MMETNPETAQTITFGRLGDSEGPSLLKLFTDLYPGLSWSEPFYKWQYEMNPSGRTASWVARSGNLVVGNYSAVPFQVRAKGKIFTGWRPQDVLTRPAFTGLGIYSKLASMANDFVKSPEYPLNFSFPNEKSHNGFIKNGWSAVFRIPLRVLDDIRKAPERAVKAVIEPLKSFDDNSEKIWISYASRIDFAVNRSARHLNWRYFQKPNGGYHAFKLSYGGSALILVLKYFDRENGERWAHLCDMFQSGEDTALYEDALQHAVNFSRENKCKALSGWWPQGKLDALFDQFQFKLQKDLTRWLLVHCTDPRVNPAELSEETRWHLTMGDSDVY